MSITLDKHQQALLAVFQAHIDAEINCDADSTMLTMTDNPYIHNIPTMIGATGREAVRKLYHSNLPNKFFPPDIEMRPISRTIGQNQLVDEIILAFTHTIEIAWMLPNIAPTGKRVEIPLVVIFNFSEGKVAHEHVYWDQASVLVQVGLLNPTGLPVYGVETAQKLAEVGIL